MYVCVVLLVDDLGAITKNANTMKESDMHVFFSL